MDSRNFFGDDLFNTHVDYPRLLAGAHRRRVTPLGAPSLIRHIAFWNPTKTGPVEGLSGAPVDVSANEPISIAGRAVQADEAIAELYRGLLAEMARGSESRVRNVSTNSEVEFEGRALIILFGAAMDGISGLTMRCPEAITPDSYRTIKVSLLWHGLATTLSFELHTEFLALTVVIDASRRTDLAGHGDDGAANPALAELKANLGAFCELSTASRERCEALHEYVYYSVWHSFSIEILAPMGHHLNALGDKFVDFRGVVVGVSQTADGAVVISSPFSREPDDGGTGIERKPLCHIKQFDQLWKFITCTQQRDTEFTVSRFLGSRAFYATALGNQPRAMLEGTGRPLCYLLYEDTLNDWQLGRLLYRVHRAGMSRIAAIMHFEALRRANQLLTDMEGELETANARLAEEPADSGDEPTDDFRDWLRTRYNFVESKFSEIAQLKLDGTLESRIERSRYYVKQFLGSTEALRIRRVSGFQRYDEFVAQRLGPVFDYIDSLGRKYTRVQNDKSILLGRIQSHDAQYNQEVVSRAQRIADLALSCVLVPYYAAFVFVHATSAVFPERFVWVTALCFGLIMFLMLRVLGPAWNRIRGCDPPAFINALTHRYMIAALLAVGGTSILKETWPSLFVDHEAVAPAQDHAASPGSHDAKAEGE